MSSEVADPLRPLDEVLEPDERQWLFGDSLRKTHANLSALTLRERVPVGVRQLFETAKNARLYTCFVYPFHQLAEMVAYQALERALKERWNNEVAKLPSIDDESFNAPGLRKLLEIAAARGWFRREGFSSRRHRAYIRFTDEQSRAAMLAMQESGMDEHPLPQPSEDELSALMDRIDVPRILAEHLPDLRNQLAHGSPRLSPTSDLILNDVRDAIEMIFDDTPPIDAPNPVGEKAPGLHQLFRDHLVDLEAKRRALMSMEPVTRGALPRGMPRQGVYVLSEAGRHLYVGRSDGIRDRLAWHCRPTSPHNMATFAFRLAKEKAGIGAGTYRKREAPADVQQRLSQEFIEAKRRVASMQIRYIEETDPIRQTLLELYVSVVHRTPYKEFNTT